MSSSHFKGVMSDDAQTEFTLSEIKELYIDDIDFQFDEEPSESDSVKITVVPQPKQQKITSLDYSETVAAAPRKSQTCEPPAVEEALVVNELPSSPSIISESSSFNIIQTQASPMRGSKEVHGITENVIEPV